MNTPVTEEQIRTVAFSLWEEAGSPEGQADEFWEKARQQLGVDSAPSDPASEGEPQTA
ncbi:Protein of unknown function [Paraburkholderia fungorum]|uniref:DUF2934 domain-containing protein n=1 Tax=Paraburkholderia fungorum TaxID=134537 RepID=A0A1H1JW17_9BURK|nr:DUF2934 domain-containing protein [Paraburkholderia fungorum]SDR54010.1 Protein of unknown function [Paraburkholderia fungorum]